MGGRSGGEAQVTETPEQNGEGSVHEAAQRLADVVAPRPKYDPSSGAFITAVFLGVAAILARAILGFEGLVSGLVGVLIAVGGYFGVFAVLNAQAERNVRAYMRACDELETKD
jgi:hypothetical protein